MGVSDRTVVRKAIKQNFSLYVALPHWWCREHGVAKGDSLVITNEGDWLRLAPADCDGNDDAPGP